MDSTYRNISIVRNVVNAATPFRPDCILSAESPIPWTYSLPWHGSSPASQSSQVLGSGTFLSSVRLRGLVADQAGVGVPESFRRTYRDVPAD